VSDATAPADLGDLELLLQSGNCADALSLVSQRLEQDPANRQLQLYSLLIRIVSSGPESAEAEIDGLRALTNLSENERAIITQILNCGLAAAARSGDAAKVWVYRRSLRRFAAGLTLDRPFSPSRIDMPRPAMALTPGQLATVRDVFLAERENPNRRTRPRPPTQSLMQALKKSQQRLGSLRSMSGTVATRIWVAGCELGGACLKQMVAALDSRMVRALTSPAVISSVISLIVVITGWHLIGAKFSQAPDADGVVETKVQDPAAQQRASLRANAPSGVVVNDVSNAKEIVTATRMAKKNPQLAVQPAGVFHAVQTVGLRGEPRYGAAKEHSLASGARVILIESRGSWLKVRSEANGATGFVRKEFLSRQSARNTIDTRSRR
jgi:hypothetical protein